MAPLHLHDIWDFMPVASFNLSLVIAVDLVFYSEDEQAQVNQ